ncbi:hypothetical protein [uncultured Campylobacter sp.]|nr:hypothetical protein [uncultured Campylobacter sp.]
MASLRRSVTSLHESVTDTQKSAMSTRNPMTEPMARFYSLKRG